MKVAICREAFINKQFLKQYTLFSQSTKFKAIKWEQESSQEGPWWRQQWKNIKNQFQMKFGNQIYQAKVRIKIYKIREKLELGVKGWEQAMMVTYPLSSFERQIYKDYFSNSQIGRSNSNALKEVCILLNQLQLVFNQSSEAMKSQSKLKQRVKQRMKHSKVMNDISETEINKNQDEKKIATQTIQNKQDNDGEDDEMSIQKDIEVNSVNSRLATASQSSCSLISKKLKYTQTRLYFPIIKKKEPKTQIKEEIYFDPGDFQT